MGKTVGKTERFLKSSARTMKTTPDLAAKRILKGHEANRDEDHP
jgi:hypothetical protein